MKRFKKILYLIAIAILLTNCSKSKTNLKSESKTNLKSENNSSIENQIIGTNAAIDINSGMDNLISGSKYVYLSDDVVKEFFKQFCDHSNNDHYDLISSQDPYVVNNKVIKTYDDLLKYLKNCHDWLDNAVFYIEFGPTIWKNKNLNDFESNKHADLYIYRAVNNKTLNVVTQYPDNPIDILTISVESKRYNNEVLLNIIKQYINNYTFQFRYLERDGVGHGEYKYSKMFNNIDELIQEYNSNKFIHNAKHYLLYYGFDLKNNLYILIMCEEK